MRKITLLMVLFALVMANFAIAQSACTCSDGQQSICQEGACTGAQIANVAGNFPAGCAETTQACCCETATADQNMPTVPPDLSWAWELEIGAESGLITGAAVEETTGAQLEAGYRFYEGTNYKHYLTKFQDGTFEGIPDGHGLSLKLEGDQPGEEGQIWCAYLTRQGTTLTLDLTKDNNAGECDRQDETTIMSKQKEYDGGALIWADLEFGVAIDTNQDFIDIAVQYDKVGCRIIGTFYGCLLCLLAPQNSQLYSWCAQDFKVCDTCPSEQCLGECILNELNGKYNCEVPVPELNTTGMVMAALVLVGLSIVAIKHK